MVCQNQNQVLISHFLMLETTFPVLFQFTQNFGDLLEQSLSYNNSSLAILGTTHKSIAI